MCDDWQTPVFVLGCYMILGWKHGKWLKSDGRQIIHCVLVSDLLDDILLPIWISVSKKAKAAATQTREIVCTTLSENNFDCSNSLQSMKYFASEAERAVWRKSAVLKMVFDLVLMVNLVHPNISSTTVLNWQKELSGTPARKLALSTPHLTFSFYSTAWVFSR